MGVSNSKDNCKLTSKEPLTQKDLDLVKSSWALIESKEDLGVAVMIRIFQEHREVKAKWIFAANLETEEEMLKNSQVKYHANKVINVLDGLIVKIENVSDLKSGELCTNLIRLGESHYHYNVGREHFPVKKEHLLLLINDKLYFNFNF